MGGQCQHLQIEALRLKLAQWERDAGWQTVFENSAARESAVAISSGSPALDRILPENGFRPGTLVEWLSYAPGDGAVTLAFRAAGCASRAATEAGHARAVVVVDAGGEFYPPAAIACGIEPARLIVVHPGNRVDHAWALDQALRCPAVTAVVAWPDGALHNGKLDGRTFRRLQLAAEQGGGLGLLIRPAAVRGEPSWADVRLLVEPLPAIKGTVPICRNGPEGASHKWGLSPLLPLVEPLRGTREAGRRLRVVLLRCRGGKQTIEVEIDDEPLCMPLD